MITRTKGIANNHINVIWVSEPETVIVMQDNPKKQQPFSGFDGLREMFETYCKSFSENIGFNETVSFFKPNIQQTKV
jgi:hypothetical protein